jgi:hypothetical protein
MNTYKIYARKTRIIVNTPDRPDEDVEMAVDVNHADLAQLLAAAPDLLDAARLAAIQLKHSADFSPALSKLLAAIAKAEGK